MNPERIAENAAIFDFELDEEDLEGIATLQKPNGSGRVFEFRNEDGTLRDVAHPKYPFKQIDQ